MDGVRGDARDVSPGLLVALARRGRARVAMLAFDTGVTPSQVAHDLARLEKAGVVIAHRGRPRDHISWELTPPTGWPAAWREFVTAPSDPGDRLARRADCAATAREPVARDAGRGRPEAATPGHGVAAGTNHHGGGA